MINYRRSPLLYDYLTVIFFGVVFFMGALGEGGLRNDDINYAAIAKTVLSSDNFMILHRGPELYLSKPPMFFWLTSLSINTFGATVFGAKFASALAAVILLVFVFRLASDAFGNVNAGYGAVIFFAFNYIIYKTSHGCRLESMLTLGVTAAIFYFGRYADKKNLLYILAAALFCGFSVMVKGYLGVMTFFICLICLFFMKKQHENSLYYHMLAAFGLFVISFMWWYGYAFTHTAFFDRFITHEAMMRINSDETLWKSVPIYKYTTDLLKFSVIMLPFLFIGFRNNIREIKNSKALIMFSVLTVIYFILIHFLTTKYSRYLYPVIVYLSIVAGMGLASVVRVNMRSVVLGISIVMACVFAVFPGSYGDINYRALSGLEKTAALNGGKLCTDKKFMRKWDDRSGLYYFTDSFKTEKCSPEDIVIQRRDTDCPTGLRTLVKNSRITACMQ